MADDETTESGPSAGMAEASGACPSALQAEIRFWTEMIEMRGDCLPAEAVERMRQARALAEFRLRKRERQHVRQGQIIGQ